MKVKNESGNQAKTGGKISKDKKLVMLPDFAEHRVNRQIKKSAGGVRQQQRQRQLQRVLRNVLQGEPAEQSAENGCGFHQRDEPQHFSAPVSAAEQQSAERESFG